MVARLRALLDGAGWSVGAAAALLALAVLAVLVVAQSPEAVLWTGQHAVGTEQNGLVLFRWQGHTYPVAVPGYRTARSVSVYFDPANPAQAMAENWPARLFTGGLVGVPLLGAVIVLLIGLTRKWRWARRDRWADGPRFGRGLDPEFVARQLHQRRNGPPPRA
jgi:Protein of unknown function (DUF3592)